MIKIFDNISDTTPIATINRALEAVMVEELNGEYMVKLTIACEDDVLATDDTTPLWQTIERGKVVEARDDLFDIARVELNRDETGELYVYAECEHISYRLNDKTMEDVNLTNATAATALAAVLSGVTGLTAGEAQGSETKTLRLNNITAQRALRLIADEYNLEIDYGIRDSFGKTAVHLLTRVGSTEGADVFAAVNVRGLNYIDDEREGQGVEVFGRIEVAEISYLDGYGVDYFIELGDSVNIVDNALGISDTRRVVYYEHDLLRPELSRIEVGRRLRRLSDVEAENAVQITNIFNFLQTGDTTVLPADQVFTNLEGGSLSGFNSFVGGVSGTVSGLNTQLTGLASELANANLKLERAAALLESLFPDGVPADVNWPIEQTDSDLGYDPDCCNAQGQCFEYRVRFGWAWRSTGAGAQGQFFLGYRFFSRRISPAPPADTFGFIGWLGTLYSQTAGGPTGISGAPTNREPGSVFLANFRSSTDIDFELIQKGLWNCRDPNEPALTNLDMAAQFAIIKQFSDAGVSGFPQPSDKFFRGKDFNNPIFDANARRDLTAQDGSWTDLSGSVLEDTVTITPAFFPDP